MSTSQNAWVLKRLRDGQTLSSRDAVLEYGIQDLPKRISELRREGYNIISTRVDAANRYGMRTHWNEYRLV